MNIIKKIIYKLARAKFVWGFDKFCKVKKGRALLYHKTEMYILPESFVDFSHTNILEAYEMGKILNQLGFVVDVIDRTADLKDIEKIKDVYDIFIGLGAGDSGKYFSDIAERVPSAKRVLYAMGPEPDLSNKITKDRHDYFRARHPNIPIVDRRLITAVDTDRLYKNVTDIIATGSEFSVGSYRHIGKPVHKINLSTYPGLSFDETEFSKKDKNKFLYFGGNGNITKGLDLTLEVFTKRPDLQLFIFGPTTEEDFNVFANPIIKNSKNIKHLGFIDVTGQKFHDVTAECAYVIMPSSSEACATSITTGMRRALVPIITIETGVPDVENFGYLVNPGTVEELAKVVDMVSKTSYEEFRDKAQKSYQESSKYTMTSFKDSLKQAIGNILN